MPSTINPAVPVPGRPLDALVVQGNFAAAYSDINALESAPQNSPNILNRGIYLTVDGGGSAITTGVKGYLYVPYACTINGWTLMADQVGSAVIDVWKVAYASFPPTSGNSIAGSELPTLAAANHNQDLTLTSWTTTVNAGDVLGFNVNSAATVTRLNLTLSVKTT